MDIVRGIELAGHLVIREELEAYVRRQQAIARAHDNKPNAEANDHGMAYAQYLAHIVHRYQVQFMFGMWAEPLLTLPTRPVDGRVACLNEILNLPFLHYWPVSPDRFYPEGVLHSIVRKRLIGPYHFHLTHNQSDGPAFRNGFGFSNIAIVPPGIDEATYRPWKRPASGDKKEYDLAINCSREDVKPTPFMLEQLKRDEPSIIGIQRDQLSSARADIVKAFATLSGVSGGLASDITDALIDEQLKDPERSLDDKLIAVVTDRLAQGRQAVEGLAKDIAVRGRVNRSLQSSEMWRRPFYAAYMAQRFKCLLIGDSDLEGWEIKADRVGFVPHYEMARQYGRAIAGLNVSRRFDAHGQTAKCFEIAGSGAVLLQQQRKGFEQLYDDGKECLVFDTPQQAAGLLQELLDDPDRRVGIAQHGFERTISQHRWMTRMGALLKALEPKLLEVTQNAPVPFDASTEQPAEVAPSETV